MVVTGIGQCSWDFLALVDGFPDPDTKPEVRSWEEQGGGPVATALVTLRRLGVDARFHGVVGDDVQGQMIRDAFIREGVGVDGLVERAGAESQKAFIVVEQGTGRRTIFWRRPTGSPLGFDELGQGFLAGSSLLHLDGLMPEVSLKAAREARTRGIPVMVDAGRVREGMLELAAECDYVVGSETFARELGYAGEPEEFFRVNRGRFPGVFTFTLGERGNYTFAGDEMFFQPAFPVSVADTTGAGDVFHGAYIYGILKRWALRETLRFASAAAAISCRRFGGRVGIPGCDEIERFLKEWEELR